MDVTTVNSIEDGIDFFNEEIAKPIVTITGKTLNTPKINK